MKTSYLQGSVHLVAILSTLCLFGCDDTSVDPWHAQKTVSESFTLTGNGIDLSRLEAITTNGSVAVGEMATNQVVVRVRKEVRAPSTEEAQDFADLVEVRLERVGNRTTISSSYPKPPPDINVNVDYDIDSPVQVELKLKAVNGPITTDGTTGAIDASTTNGNVDAHVESLAGSVSLSTVNGTIKMDAAGGDAPISATAVNGRIDVTLPRGLSGVLHAETGNGSVQCDFPVTGEHRSNRVIGAFGDDNGTTPVDLRTTNGGIRVRRR